MSTYLDRLLQTILTGSLSLAASTIVSAQFVGIETNALADAIGLPQLSVELPIAPQVSAVLGGVVYAPYYYENDDETTYDGYAITGSVRQYLNQRGRHDRFYFFGNLQYSRRLSTSSYLLLIDGEPARDEQTWLAVGVGVGYVQAFGSGLYVKGGLGAGAMLSTTSKSVRADVITVDGLPRLRPYQVTEKGFNRHVVPTVELSVGYRIPAWGKR